MNTNDSASGGAVIAEPLVCALSLDFLFLADLHGTAFDRKQGSSQAGKAPVHRDMLWVPKSLF